MAANPLLAHPLLCAISTSIHVLMMLSSPSQPCQEQAWVMLSPVPHSLQFWWPGYEPLPPQMPPQHYAVTCMDEFCIVTAFSQQNHSPSCAPPTVFWEWAVT